MTKKKNGAEPPEAPVAIVEEAPPAVAEKPPTEPPRDLMTVALERGAGIDVIERIAALMERQEANEARKAYARDMAIVQAKIPVVIKNAENTHTHSRYAKNEHILKECKSVWVEGGFSLNFEQLPMDPPREGWMRTGSICRHKDGHVERAYIDLPLDGTGSAGQKSNMNPVQAVCSTGTYAERRLTCRVWNITILDEAVDLDGNSPAGMITKEQIAILNSLIEECGKAGVKPPHDHQKFLKIFAVGEQLDLGDIPAAGYEPARRLLWSRLPAEVQKRINDEDAAAAEKAKAAGKGGAR